MSFRNKKRRCGCLRLWVKYVHDIMQCSCFFATGLSSRLCCSCLVVVPHFRIFFLMRDYPSLFHTVLTLDKFYLIQDMFEIQCVLIPKLIVGFTGPLSNCPYMWWYPERVYYMETWDFGVHCSPGGLALYFFFSFHSVTSGFVVASFDGFYGCSISGNIFRNYLHLFLSYGLHLVCLL